LEFEFDFLFSEKLISSSSKAFDNQSGKAYWLSSSKAHFIKRKAREKSSIRACCLLSDKARFY